MLLGGLLWIAWAHAPGVRAWVEARLGPLGAPSEPSPELAERAVERYEAFLETGGRVRFTEAEVESVLRFHPAVPRGGGVVPVAVRLGEGEATVVLSVAVERLPALPELESLAGILPDTVQVRLRGVVLTLEGGETVFVLRGVEAAGVPLPSRLHARVVGALPVPPAEGLPPATVPLPLPAGVRAAYIQGGRLVLVGPDDSALGAEPPVRLLTVHFFASAPWLES